MQVMIDCLRRSMLIYRKKQDVGSVEWTSELVADMNQLSPLHRLDWRYLRTHLDRQMLPEVHLAAVSLNAT